MNKINNILAASIIALTATTAFAQTEPVATQSTTANAPVDAHNAKKIDKANHKELKANAKADEKQAEAKSDYDKTVAKAKAKKDKKDAEVKEDRTKAKAKAEEAKAEAHADSVK